MFDIVLLEGITGAGKSTLFGRLQADPWAAGYESRLVLGQAYTLRVAPAERIVDHLVGLARGVADYARLHAGSEFAARRDGRGSMLVLAEGFHLYGLVEHLPENLRPAALRRVEEELGGLRVHLVSLEMAESTVLERSVRSPLRVRGPGWREFTRRFGRTEDEVADYFIRRQRGHQRLVAASSLPVLRIDTSEADWDAYRGRIVERVSSGVMAT